MKKAQQNDLPDSLRFSFTTNMSALPKTFGWVGLGLMGYPMAANLLNKTDADTQLFVYDVVQDAVDKFVQEGKGRVHACSSSREVADKSVRSLPFLPIKV